MDRLISSIVLDWNKIYFTGKIVTIYGFSLVAFFFAFNIYFALNLGYIETVTKNVTQGNISILVINNKVVCHSNPNGWFIINFWSWVRN